MTVNYIPILIYLINCNLKIKPRRPPTMGGLALGGWIRTHLRTTEWGWGCPAGGGVGVVVWACNNSHLFANVRLFANGWGREGNCLQFLISPNK